MKIMMKLKTSEFANPLIKFLIAFMYLQTEPNVIDAIQVMHGSMALVLPTPLLLMIH